MAALYSRATRLPMGDLLNVYGTATNNEKVVLAPLQEKKAQQYFKMAGDKFMPAERQSDPVYRKLRALYPSMAPY